MNKLHIDKSSVIVGIEPHGPRISLPYSNMIKLKAKTTYGLPDLLFFPGTWIVTSTLLLVDASLSISHSTTLSSNKLDASTK